MITSRFKLGGTTVSIETACDPESDTIGVRIISPLIKQGRLRVRLGFPRGYDMTVKNTPALDWSNPEAHESRVIEQTMIGGRRSSAGERPGDAEE